MGEAEVIEEQNNNSSSGSSSSSSSSSDTSKKKAKKKTLSKTRPLLTMTPVATILTRAKCLSMMRFSAKKTIARIVSHLKMIVLSQPHVCL